MRVSRLIVASTALVLCFAASALAGGDEHQAMMMEWQLKYGMPGDEHGLAGVLGRQAAHQLVLSRHITTGCHPTSRLTHAGRYGCPTLPRVGGQGSPTDSNHLSPDHLRVHVSPHAVGGGPPHRARRHEHHRPRKT